MDLSTRQTDAEKDLGEPFELREDTPLYDLAERRARQNMDLAIAVVDYHGRSGTGKTTLCCKLGQALDRSGKGLRKHMAFMDPEPFQQAFVNNARKTPLILDELEKEADKYQAATKAARAVREIMDIGRITEKYVIVNLPDARSLNDDLLAKFDVLIAVKQRGLGLVHFLPHEFYNQKILTKKKQTLRWDTIPKSHQVAEVYDYLTQEKLDYLNQQSSDQWIHVDEVEDRVAKTERETRRETRDQMLEQIHSNTALTQTDIASALSGDDLHDELELTQSGVSRILSNV